MAVLPPAPHENTAMQIGKHTIPTTPDGFATVLAPMASITNPPFRVLAREHGCGMTVTEMVSSELLCSGSAIAASVALRMERAPGERLFVVQLFGGEPALMAEAARLAEAEGADVIDVNMGCPVRKISGKYNAGVALMRDPARAAAIVDAMVRAVRVPITAKIRAGWDDAHVNAPEVARALEGAGVAMITVHGRTRAMVHEGEARLEVIRSVKRAVRVPVVGNGGVRSLEDARRMHRETGCEGVMIGRGAHGNPWLFRSLSAGRDLPPSEDERFDAMARHLELYVLHAGEARAAREMRKHLLWYLAGTPALQAFRAELPRLDTVAALREAIARHHETALARQDSPG